MLRGAQQDEWRGRDSMLSWLTLWLMGLVTAAVGSQSAAYRLPPGSSTRSVASKGFMHSLSKPLPHSCTFEEPCSWKYSSNVKVVTGQEVNNSWVPQPRVLPPGPFVDASNNTHGQCLTPFERGTGRGRSPSDGVVRQVLGTDRQLSGGPGDDASGSGTCCAPIRPRQSNDSTRLHLKLKISGP